MWNVRLLTFLFVVAVTLATASRVQAQTSKSEMANLWSPPDKIFTVQVPKKLSIVKGGPSEASDPNAVKTYGVKSAKDTYIVYILKYKEYAKKSTEDKFGGLFSLIGGDDDHDFAGTNLKIDGLPSQEIVYKNQTNRGLFIDAGNIVVVLGMIAKARKDLNSPIANRFFRSFRLNREIQNENSIVKHLEDISNSNALKP